MVGSATRVNKRELNREPRRVTPCRRHVDLVDANLRKRRFGRNPAFSSARDGRSDDLNLQFKRDSRLHHDLSPGAPGTNIGAAHPVNLQGGMDSTMAEKVTNDAAAFIRTISEKRNRNIQ